MAIFARRRLQSMLDDLANALDAPKARDLINRIESKEIEQALPAEMELGIVWAVAQLGPAEIEPYWYGTETLPDAFSEHLIRGHQTIVEVAGLSDAALHGDEGMRNASRKISHEAGRIRRGAATRLSYYFFEDNRAVGNESIRSVCVPRGLSITPYIRGALEHWLKGRDRSAGDTIRLKEGELDVVVTWHDTPQSRYNFWSSMPPEIRSLRNNYIYGALRRKAKQLKSAEFTGTKCVILADVGSTALRYVDRRDHMGRVFNGGQIISAFLGQENPGIDVVAAITPNRARHRLDNLEATIEWKMVVYSRQGVTIDLSGFSALARVLPPPQLEGYQARQLDEQGVFAPKRRGRYLGMNLTWQKGEKSEIRFSARALLDTLAGRETPERLMRIASVGDNNIFKLHLDRGETISSIRLESGGKDEDDDWVVVEFRDDAAARALSLPGGDRDN
jgi:hypothetical protein